MRIYVYIFQKLFGQIISPTYHEKKNKVCILNEITSVVCIN